MRHFLIRGIVGAGKTKAAKYIAVKYDGLRLSTDRARREVRFRDSVRYGDKFREDPAFRAQQVFAYELMLAAARRVSDTERAVQEAVDYVPVFCDKLYNKDGRRDDFRMILSPSEKDMSVNYLQNKIAVSCDTVVCESTFNRREFIDRFCSFIKPYIIDVGAPDSKIRKRLSLPRP